MTDLDAAISARMEQNWAEKDAGQTFEPDPGLEEWGRKLDLLQAHDPQQYASPGLASIRQQVTTYRLRQARHKETR